MDIIAQKTDSVTVRVFEDDEFFGEGCAEMVVPASFPAKALAAVEFLRESELDAVIKDGAFETAFIDEDGNIGKPECCEVVIQACGNVWVNFDYDGDTKCYLGTAQEFTDRVRQALAEAQPAAAPKMGV
jgi:hypothetical protein